jgi:PEP-CTERM motif-containing protein
MQRFFFVLIAAMVMASVAMATPACPSQPPSSVNYSAYLGPGFTCDINNLEFSDFGFQAGGTQPPTAAQIGVMTITTLGNEGFQFNPAFNVANGNSADAVLTFEVTGLNGAQISDLFIAFNGDPGTGGAASFVETYCTDSFNTGCNQFSVTNPPGGNLSKEIDIAPTTHLFITKDFGVTAGRDSVASISKVVNQYSNVPEPSQMALMLVGMGGLFLARRKFKASAQ